MRRIVLMIATLVLLAAPSWSCGGSESPAATATPVASGSSLSEPTKAPTQTPEPTSTVAPTATIAPEPTNTPIPTPTRASGRESLEDLLSKATWYDNFSCDVEMTTAGGEKVTGSLAFKDQKMRMDVIQAGISATVLIDQDEQEMIIHQPDQSVAMRMQLDNGMMTDAADVSPADYMRELQQGAVITGADMVDGKPCTVLEKTTDDGYTKACLWVENGFPLRTEVKSGDELTVTEFRNIRIGVVSDSVFELPPGVEVQDMSDLFSGLLTPEAEE